ncbi:MAG: succinate dehydrogenase, cytochrome b556 subunit [Methylophilaceae bacterium]|jgi:succinate dehydrogenase / fumarate reductase cytochrome b subunit|nr:succinate dehydrogenase, cytochrome b556 subunit [Methylophilaceae bacterium]
MVRKRPKNLNLLTIRLPVPALVSIMHRVSGALLFLSLPLWLLLFWLTVSSEQSYQLAQVFLHSLLVKLLLVLLAWAFFHHACAGIRHLALDAHLGLRLRYARASSMMVLLLTGILLISFTVAIW